MIRIGFDLDGVLSDEHILFALGYVFCYDLFSFFRDQFNTVKFRPLPPNANVEYYIVTNRLLREQYHTEYWLSKNRLLDLFSGVCYCEDRKSRRVHKGSMIESLGLDMFIESSINEVYAISRSLRIRKCHCTVYHIDDLTLPFNPRHIQNYSNLVEKKYFSEEEVGYGTTDEPSRKPLISYKELNIKYKGLGLKRNLFRSET